MLTLDARTQARIAAVAERVLIVDPHLASGKLLGELLRDICPCQIWTAASAEHGLAVADRIQPTLVFLGLSDGLDGPGFTRKLRRSELGCRRAPVIVISAEATAAAIIGARDAGAHEFLRRPYTIKDLMRRLEAVSARPRDWVEGMGYIGPDRRRFNSGDYSGRMKRRVDHAVTPHDARLAQALKILKAALAAIESDPRQALRALIAQADEIGAVAEAQGDSDLSGAARALGAKLADLDVLTLRRAAVAPSAGPLLARLLAEAPDGQASAA